MKLTKRKLAELQNKGIIRRELDGTVKPALGSHEAAPTPVKDNKKRSWRVHGFERDYDGYIVAVEITEK